MRPFCGSLGRRMALALAVALLVGAGAVAWRGPLLAEDQQQGIAQANALSQAFRAAAEKITPTVVMIKTITRPGRADSGSEDLPRRSPRGRNPFKGTPFEDFFNDDDLPGFRSQPFIQQGVGSGVIIDPSGIILTNAHVVEGAGEVTIQLSDGREVKATDIKTDEQTDLAVLRIKVQEKLPAAKLGDSNKMAIGDWVLAVGNPFELEHTVSAGIISGTKRLLPSGKRAEYLQTDAAINPGNSGGPLVNLDGEVIGINTAIASNSGGYQGVGFAIPSSIAKWVITQLIEKGAVARAYLGVGITDITNGLSAKLGVARNQGVLVTEVFPDTPAAKAGFQEGDVITTFAGTQVHNPHELQQLVERAPFNSKQQVGIVRDGKPATLQVEVQAMPKRLAMGRTAPRDIERRGAESHFHRDLGLEVADLTPDVAEQLGFQGLSGALITGVREDSLAAQGGLRRGWVVLRVGKTTVKNAADFEKAMKSEDVEKGVMLLVRTATGNRFIVLQRK